MTNRTKVRARHHLERRQLSFDVSEPKPHFFSVEFAIDFRRPILMSSGYWSLYQPMACVGALPTLFGQEVLDRVKVIGGIQPSLAAERPFRLTLFVGTQLAEQSPSGLPAHISLALEQAVLESKPTFASAVRWLRRFV